jgi:zinc/manganese transport system substrate-binding protein
MYRSLLVLLGLLLAGVGHAQIQVAATTSNMGMLARTVGGDAVNVTVMAPPDRNAHYLEARPSMMAALRRADIVVAVGAELEVGWLPSAIQGAANREVYPGRTGYFEAAAQVELMDTDLPADRAMGDVHPTGNPHLYMDPPRMAQVARALARRFGELDPAGAGRFEANAVAFAEAVEQRVPGWRRRAEGAPGVVLYHKDADYLARLLDVTVLGYIEPLPGVPPTARHLRDLVNRLEGTRGVIVHANFEAERGPRFVAERLGWSVHSLPSHPPIDASADDYLAMIDRWVQAMAAPAP